MLTSSSSAPSGPPADPQKRQRQRIINACWQCRQAKTKCSVEKPRCEKCIAKGLSCTYVDHVGPGVLSAHKRKDRELNMGLRAAAEPRQRPDPESLASREDHEDLPTLPFTMEVGSYDSDADIELTDVGCWIGKCHFTDRIGGQFRPGMDKELDLIYYKTSHMPEWLQEQELFPPPPDAFDSISTTPRHSFLEPSASYLAPNLGRLSSRPPSSLKDCLPSFDMATKILDQYWSCVHPIVRVLHRPSFEVRWQRFWDSLKSSTRPAASLQAVVFAVLFSGLATMDEDVLRDGSGQEKQIWLEKLQLGTEMSLDQARALFTSTVETLQALVAYLLLMCRAEVTRAHSSLVAGAIRIAQQNGLQSDGEERGYNPVEMHVRRLIWMNLCVLDIRTTEAQGPYPIVRPGDYTTKMPSNLDDTEIMTHGPSPQDASTWTEMTVPLIAFRCNELHREMWIARHQLEEKQTNITDVIKNIESFRAYCSMEYAPSNRRSAIQRYGDALLDMQSARTYGLVLSKFHLHPSWEMPDRLKQIMIHNGIITMDRVIEIEQSPAYAPWRWYARALQQNHYALLMVVEMSLNPRRKEWAKIWRGLDYVFEKPNTWPPIQKARRILNELRWKMRLFTGQRKLRAPQEVKQRLEEAVQFEKDEQERREISSSGNSETWEGSSGIVSLTQREALPEADATGGTAEPHASKDQVPSSRVDNNDATVVEQPNHGLRTCRDRQPQQSHREPSVQVPNSADQHLKPNIPYGGSFLVEVPKPEIYVNWPDLEPWYPSNEFNGDITYNHHEWEQQMQDLAPSMEVFHGAGNPFGPYEVDPYPASGHACGQASDMDFVHTTSAGHDECQTAAYATAPSESSWINTNNLSQAWVAEVARHPPPERHQIRRPYPFESQPQRPFPSEITTPSGSHQHAEAGMLPYQNSTANDGDHRRNQRPRTFEPHSFQTLCNEMGTNSLCSRCGGRGCFV